MDQATNYNYNESIHWEEYNDFDEQPTQHLIRVNKTPLCDVKPEICSVISSDGDDEEQFDDTKSFDENFIDGNGRIWDRESFIKNLDDLQRGKNLLQDSSTYQIGKRSVRTQTGLEEKKILSCPLCEYKCRRKCDMKCHINKAHLKIDNLKCQLCNYNTYNKHALAKHINRVHLKLRPHKCHLCNYASSCLKTLKDHIAGHLNIKWYKCDLCEYRTNNSSCILQHKRDIHLRNMVRKCNLCEYKTTRKANLKGHMDAVHLKIKNYGCQFCEYRTTRGNYLRGHINSIHLNPKTLNCKLCNFVSANRIDLKRHVKEAHSTSHCSLDKSEPNSDQVL